MTCASALMILQWMSVIIPSVAAVGGAIIGVLLGASIAGRNERTRRYVDSIERSYRLLSEAQQTLSESIGQKIATGKTLGREDFLPTKRQFVYLAVVVNLYLPKFWHIATDLDNKFGALVDHIDKTLSPDHLSRAPTDERDKDRKKAIGLLETFVRDVEMFQQILIKDGRQVMTPRRSWFTWRRKP